MMDSQVVGGLIVLVVMLALAFILTQEHTK